MTLKASDLSDAFSLIVEKRIKADEPIPPMPQPNYEQFKKPNPRDRIPDMSERAHKELSPYWDLLTLAEDCLKRRDLVFLESVARRLLLFTHTLIQDKVDLSGQIDALVRHMFDEIARAHFKSHKYNSPTAHY